MKIIENRGSGINTMLDTMKSAHLEPPQFKETRSTFMVTFKNHNFFTKESVSWLNSLGDISISDKQATALVYVKNNNRITNREYQELNSVDSVSATKELRYLLEQGLIVQHGTRGGAYYTLNVNDGLIVNEGYESDEKVISIKELSSSGSEKVPTITSEKEELIKRISCQALQKKRLKSEVLEGYILELCDIQLMSKNELMKLLDRTDKVIREKVKKLVEEEKLGLIYPENITHPKQAYYTKK